MIAKGVQLPQVTQGEINNPPQTATVFLDSGDGQVKAKLADGSIQEFSGGGGSGASTALDNLTDPTAINQSLLPEVPDNLDLGSADNFWAYTHAYGNRSFLVDVYNADDGFNGNIKGRIRHDSVNNDLIVSAVDTDTNIKLLPNGTGHIDASSTQIKEVADPVDENDAVNKKTMDKLGKYQTLTVDSTRNEANGVTDLTDLSVNLEANKNYYLTFGLINFNATQQVVVDLLPNYPTGIEYAVFGSSGPNETLVVATTLTPANGSLVLRFLNSGPNYYGMTNVFANIKTGANAGTFTFRWQAKSVSNTNVTLKAGSFVKIEEIG